ncbi:MAG: hypothetical protein FWD88_01575 [Treponema sp.]|nr:hypothetical protein [Treponema sp.]
MKRFYLNMAAFSLLFWSVYGCSVGGTQSSHPTPDTPELLSVEVVSETNVDFEFSAPVMRVQVSFAPSLEIASIAEEGRTVRVHLERSLEPGRRIVADIRAEDAHGNIFSESVPFEKNAQAPDEDAPPPGECPDEDESCTKEDDTSPEEDDPCPDEDDSPPEEDDSCQKEDDTSGDQDEAPGDGGTIRLVINELRTESLTTPSTPLPSHRAEFIEFRALSAGNLEGVRVFIYRSGTGTPTEFVFPSQRVEAGEYIVLHLRTLQYQFVDAAPTAHNFWIPGSSSRLNKTSTVYALDPDGAVLAAVMLSEHPDADWTGTGRTHFAEVARFLFEQGAWKSADGGIATPADAVLTARVGTAVTRSVSRDETVPDTNTAADWYITANNGATPGMPNDPRRL